MEQSKSFSFNKADILKLAKSIGIAAAGAGAVMVLGGFNFLDADAMTAIYTAIGTFVVNAIRIFMKGN